MIWREPAEESVDLYPGLVVHDGRKAGSITASRSRLPLWAFAGWDWDDVVSCWDYIEDEYGWTRERHSGFLRDLLEARGEFARLLLILADVERVEGERNDAMFADAEAEGHHPAVFSPGIVNVSPWDEDALHPQSWWQQDDLRGRMRDQLRRCLDVLDGGGQA